MIDDEGFNLPTRDGVAVGHGLENRMIDKVGGARTIRTEIRDLPGGGQVMLRTRNGFPEFTTITKHLASAFRIWHGLYTTRDQPLENIDLGNGYNSIMSNKGTLLLRDWGDETDGALMDAVISGTGSTYYSNFPLVDLNLHKIPTSAAYSIAPYPGGPYTIDSETIVSQTDKDDRTVTVTKTDNVDFQTYERGGDDGVGRSWWPWKEAATGKVFWFSVVVTADPATSTYIFVTSRSDGASESGTEVNVVVGTTVLTYTQVFGSGRESWAEWFEYDYTPQHSPSGAIALLQFYIMEGMEDTDTRSNSTNNILGAVVRVNVVDKSSVTVASELTAWDVFPPFKVNLAQASQGYQAGRVGSGKSIHPTPLNLCTINISRVERKDDPTDPNKTTYILYKFKSTASFSGLVWPEWDRPPGWKTETQESKFILSVFFPGTEAYVAVRVSVVVTTLWQYISKVTMSGASGYGYKEREYLYTADPYFDGDTIPEHNEYSGGATEVWERGSRVVTTQFCQVSVGGAEFSVTGPTTGTESLTKTTWNLTYSSTGFQRVPYAPPVDTSNYAIADSATVEYASFTTASSSIVDSNNVIDTPGRVLLWVTMKTNNVVSVSDWVYDDAASVRTSLLTAGGDSVTNEGSDIQHASWNPRTGELATSDKRVQWV